MLSIRLSRVGKKKAPVYRLVVMPKTRDPWANSVEILGHYNPRMNPKEFVVKADRIKYWISNGAQPSDTVWNLLVEYKVIEGEKRTATHLTKKRTTKIASEKKAEEDAKAAKAAKAAEAAEAAKAAEAAAKEAAEAEKAAAKAAAEAPVEAAPEAPAETPAAE
jgi:small subunit ribosomal protein S16